MIRIEIAYSLRREHEERRASLAAVDVCGRIAHRAMADRYADRAARATVWLTATDKAR